MEKCGVRDELIGYAGFLFQWDDVCRLGWVWLFSQLNWRTILKTKLMGDPTCGKRWCSNRLEYYHLEQDTYYWEVCAYSMFDESQFEKIGSVAVIKEILELCENLLDYVEYYARIERLEKAWESALDYHKVFAIELNSIKKQLVDALKAKKLKNLLSIQKRSSKLKSAILI